MKKFIVTIISIILIGIASCASKHESTNNDTTEWAEDTSVVTDSVMDIVVDSCPEAME